MQPPPGEKQGLQQEFQIDEKAPPPAFVVARSSLVRPQNRENILFAAFGWHKSFVIDFLQSMFRNGMKSRFGYGIRESPSIWRVVRSISQQEAVEYACSNLAIHARGCYLMTV